MWFIIYVAKELNSKIILIDKMFQIEKLLKIYT